MLQTILNARLRRVPSLTWIGLGGGPPGFKFALLVLPKFAHSFLCVRLHFQRRGNGGWIGSYGLLLLAPLSRRNLPYVPAVALVDAPARFLSDGVYFPRWISSELSFRASNKITFSVS
jgi:hypothetical protein